MHEKQLRIRYIRVLEKFFTRTVSLLRLENFDRDLFIERTKKNFEDMDRVKPVDLNSNYLVNLKNFINKTMNYLENHTDEFNDERDTLLKDANLLQKERSKRNYKKDKHKNSKYNDGY